MIETNVSHVPKMRLLFPALGGVLLSVAENEPVYAVQEGYAMPFLGAEDHRFQVLLMPRGDHLAAFWRDLGPASDFRMEVGGVMQQAPAYQQPVLSEHSVAECLYMAEVGRMDDFAAKLLAQQIDESTLFADYARMIAEDMYLVKNRSTFGRYARVQRNSFSNAGAREQQRRLKEAGKW